MKLTTLLQFAGLLHIGLVWAGATMPRTVRLAEHLKPLPEFIRRLVWVYYVFVGLTLIGFGALTFLFAPQIAAGEPLAMALCCIMALFWTIRFAVALFVFDVRPYLTNGLYRIGYHATNLVFAFLVALYGWVVWRMVRMKIQLPRVRGLIDRRLLLNFRVKPEVLEPILPRPFRPKQVDGFGIAGICLIRLNDMRIRFAPQMLGVNSENAAHRIAVEWDQDGIRREGVFIPRRGTSSALQARIGGRIFPGLHHLAEFQVQESDSAFCVEMNSRDGETHVLVEATCADAVPEGSVFRTVDEASDFFRNGALGYSVTADAKIFDGLELKTFRWEMQPLRVTRVESSFFADRNLFPPGSAQFDSAFLMRRVEHEWIGRGTLET
jgi:Uncharacterized conserved protein (COG2071).